MKKTTFVPTATIALQASKGLELHQKFGKGGTSIGLNRARQLKNREELSVQTVKRMHSYFARHEVDKQGKDFFNKEKPSKGYIAWLLWGGDAGKKWADTIVQKLAASSEKSK